MSLEIDWSSAEVRGDDVTVDLAGKVSKQSRERFEAVRSLLGESSGGWDDVKLVKRTIHVRGLRPQAEHDAAFVRRAANAALAARRRNRGGCRLAVPAKPGSTVATRPSSL